MVIPHDVAADLSVIDPGWDLGKSEATLDPDDPAETGPETATDPGADPLNDPGVVDVDTGDPGGQADPGAEVCMPACDGKQCGKDGCGGTCGTCPAGHECIAAQCVCVPACSGRKCGDDGCGTTCPPGCPAGVECLAPKDEEGAWCASMGTCKPSVTLTCDEYNDKNGYSGLTGATMNTDVLDVYSQACGSKIAHGPEVSFLFVPDQNGDVTVKLSLHPSFLDLYAIRDDGAGCSTQSCISTDHSKITLAVEVGKTYWLVVDASKNDTGFYSLELHCSWYVPPRR